MNFTINYKNNLFDIVHDYVHNKESKGEFYEINTKCKPGII